MNKQTTSGPTGFGWLRSLFAFRHQNPVARILSTLVALATAALFTVVATSTPAAAADPCPIPGGFEIDGDMSELTCDPAGDDWNTSGITVQSTTQGGTYSTAGKDGGDPSTWVSAGSTPDKTDFERAYATSRTVDVGGELHYFVYVAWERTNTSGTQGYAIEIDNAEARVAADQTPQPDRSQGGTVFYIASQGSSPPVFDSACAFDTQSDYGDTCTTSDASVTSAINTATISDPLAGTSQVAGSFFEVALDITELTGVAPSCPGASAASVYLRSITGQAKNGNLKAYMAPLEVAPDSTCVAPPIETTATPGGSLVAPGAAQHDDVTVGTEQAPGIGTVKFYLCQPDQVTAGGCEGTAGTLVSTETLDGSGAASSDAVNGSSTPNDNATGKYCWRAEFTPGENDHHYLAGKHTNASGECFTVVFNHPTISTQIAVTGANAPGLGFTTLGDSAQLSGFAGSVTGETVNFDLYGPFDGAVPADCTAGTAAFSTTGTLNASGAATGAATFVPTEAGTYIWIASYGGNANNDSASGECTDANESATIVGAQVDVTKSANPPGPVTAGSPIGFDVTVSNAGSVPATGVHVTDNLPAGADGVTGGDLEWSLDPAYTDCEITGSVGSQVLDCTFDQVAGPGSLPVIHVTSPTSPADCGVVKNQASVSTTNGTGGDSDVATVTVQCPGLQIVKDADAPSVSAGSPIGFTVTATNTGQGSATGAVIKDVLPTGPGITWTIDTTDTPPSGPLSCAIADGTGADAGHQVLSCTGTLGEDLSQVVHVTSPTQWTGSGEGEINSCLGGPEEDGVYPNTATVSATNVTNAPTDDAQTQVLCPDLSMTKTADAASVDAGQQIGFIVTVSNSGAEGTGTASDVAIDDPLPTGPGVSWLIASGPENCSIKGAAPSQTLHCSFDLAPGASLAVHVVSATTNASCQAYPNAASLTATNHPSLTARATVTVANCVIVSPPIVSPPQHHPNVLPNTGGPQGWLAPAALMMLLAGTSLVVGDRRGRRRS